MSSNEREREPSAGDPQKIEDHVKTARSAFLSRRGLLRSAAAGLAAGVASVHSPMAGAQRQPSVAAPLTRAISSFRRGTSDSWSVAPRTRDSGRT